MSTSTKALKVQQAITATQGLEDGHNLRIFVDVWTNTRDNLRLNPYSEQFEREEEAAWHLWTREVDMQGRAGTVYDPREVVAVQGGLF